MPPIGIPPLTHRALPRGARAVTSLLAAPLLLCAAAGCAGLASKPPSPPSYEGMPVLRFWRVEEGLYRGGYAPPRELAALVERYHLRSIIKLNPDWQGKDVVPPGVVLYDEPIPAVLTPSQRDVERILDELERAPRPLLVHCRLGADRSGLIVALYRIRHGARVEDAERDMRQHGFRPYRGLARVFANAVAAVRCRGPGVLAPGSPDWSAFADHGCAAAAP